MVGQTYYSADLRRPRSRARFSFQAGGRTFRPVVSHSTSGTLMPIFEGFVLFFILLIYFLLTFKENLSELQPCLGNWFLGSRNTGNSVSDCSILKITWGSTQGALWRRKMSRSVLSEICPLLYKTVEIPSQSTFSQKSVIFVLTPR